MEENTKTLQDEIRDILSAALFECAHAQGIVIALATDDNTITFFGAGDLVVRMGLWAGVREKMRNLFDETRAEEEEDDE